MSSVIAILFAVIAIIAAYALDHGDLKSLVNIQAFLIVIVGSVLATVAQQHPPKCWLAVRVLVRSLIHEPDFYSTIKRFYDLSHLSRTKGYLALDGEISSSMYPMIRDGIQLATDGRNAAEIRNHLSIQQERQQEIIFESAEFFESLGGYAPTFGIVGAVLGLIQVMSNIESPELLASGIATAFVATVYGVASANLVFLPMAQRLKNYARDMDRFHSMIVEACVGIAEGENPRNLEFRLKGFI